MNTRITGAAAVLGVALVVVACSSPSASPAPSTTSSSEGSAAASQAAGPAEIGVTFTGTIPDGWVAGDDGVPTPESASFAVSQNMLVMAANCDFEPEPGVGSTAAEIVAALANRDGIQSLGAEDATLDGLSGQQLLDFHAAADGTGATCDDGEQTFIPLWGHLEDVGWTFIGASPTETYRLVVLDVPGGGNVFLALSAGEPEDVADYVDAAMEVMNGLEFDVP